MIPTRGSSSGKRRRGTDPNPQFGSEGCKTQVSTGPTTIPFRYREGPSHQNMNYNMLDQGFSNTTMLPKHSTAPGLVTKPGSLHLQARNHQELMATMLPKHSTPAVCLVQAPIAVAFVGPQGAGKSLLLCLGGCCAPYRRCWSPEPSCSVSLSWLLATAKTSRTVLTFSSFQTLSTSSLSSLPSYTGN